MKKIIILFVMTMLVLTGCGKKDNNDTSELYTEEELKELSEVNDNFTDLRLESELEWYNDYITPIKESNWKMSKEELESILKIVEEKREEVNSIDKKEINKFLEYRFDELTKDEDDKGLRERIDNEEKKIPIALKGMNSILEIIENDIKLGLDGKFSSDDISKIENSFSQIIKIYEDEID